MECRKVIFLQARVRHEPSRLIKSSIWGSNLFPADLVREILDAAAKANQSLRQKWDMLAKRSAEQAIGEARFPRPSKRSRKKLAALRRQQQHSQQQLTPMIVPLQQAIPSTSGRGRHQQQLFTVVQASPATNPYYEQQGSSHRWDYSGGRRGGYYGGRGAAGRSRGQNRGSARGARGRAKQSFQTGRGGASR